MTPPDWQLDEERRAALWREQVARRVAFQTALWTSLAGSPVAYRAFLDNWLPLIEWLAERDEPEVEPEDDYELDPLRISETVNVGT